MTLIPPTGDLRETKTLPIITPSSSATNASKSDASSIMLSNPPATSDGMVQGVKQTYANRR